MYHETTEQEIRRFLKIPDDYRIDALLVTGTHPKSKEYPHLYEAIEKIGVSYREETIDNSFFGEVKSFIIGDTRIWFDVVYGAAYLSELIHVTALLGSRANILLGTCGALWDDMRTGEIVIPTTSFGNESATRMYQRENETFLYDADAGLSKQLESSSGSRKIHRGKLMTVQAMMAETEDDVKNWSHEGYIGVDMESAIFFAVSNHFRIPSAALLYVADNLVKNKLVINESFELSREQRIAIRKENYLSALKVLLGYK